MSAANSSTPVQTSSPPRAGIELALLDWFLPGAGFFIVGRRARGATQLAIVLVTFVIGLVLRGGVIWPSWTLDSGFNLVNIITFIIQMGAGLPALVSLVCHLAGSQVGPLNTIIGGVPSGTYFELGSYFLLVAGALNYFATCNFYDRLVKPTPRYKPQETETVAP